MIRSFRHRGLARFWNNGDRRGINRHLVPRIERMLAALDAAGAPTDLNLPGYRFHSLTGRDKGRFSLRVTGNRRLTFALEGDDVVDVDLEDYH